MYDCVLTKSRQAHGFKPSELVKRYFFKKPTSEMSALDVQRKLKGRLSEGSDLNAPSGLNQNLWVDNDTHTLWCNSGTVLQQMIRKLFYVVCMWMPRRVMVYDRNRSREFLRENDFISSTISDVWSISVKGFCRSSTFYALLQYTITKKIVEAYS